MYTKIWAQIQVLINYKKCQSSTESKSISLLKCSTVTGLTIFICIYLYTHTYICIYRYKYIKGGKRLASTNLFQLSPSPWKIFVFCWRPKADHIQNSLKLVQASCQSSGSHCRKMHTSVPLKLKILLKYMIQEDDGKSLRKSSYDLIEKNILT